jgi:hypothetical protein
VQWHTYVAYFFGGVFLVNSVPHFTNGVSGRRFPTPFAFPLGKAQSSPTVNVLWGTLILQSDVCSWAAWESSTSIGHLMYSLLEWGAC